MIFRLGCSLKTEFIRAILAALLLASAFVGHVCDHCCVDCASDGRERDGQMSVIIITLSGAGAQGRSPLRGVCHIKMTVRGTIVRSEVCNAGRFCLES